MKIVLAMLALAGPVPAMAQNAAVAPAAPAQTAAVAEGTPLAIEIAGKLFPNGTYRKMLGPQFSQMLTGMTDSASTMPIGPILKAAGLPEADVAKLDKATIGEIMAITDPVYKERMRRTMDGMFAAMIPLFEQLEPDLRAGLAVSLDRRFTPAQLGDLRAFFATPTGGEFASQQMLLFMDPAVMGRMQTAMPKVMEAMPKLIAEAGKATADLPKARTYKDLTPADRAKLAKLLGADPAKLKP